MTPGVGLGDAVRPPKSPKQVPCLPWPYPADVARQLPGRSWHGPQPSHPWYPRMWCRVHNSLGQAAKLLPPGELLDEAQRTSSTAGQVELRYHASNLISEAPGILWQHLQVEMHYRTTSHVVVGNALLCCMCIEPQNGGRPPLTVPKREREVVVLVRASSIGTGCASQAYSSERLVFAGLHLLKW